MSDFIALSHSKINTFNGCPRQFFLQYISKVYPKEGDNPYFIKGNRIHKELENYVVWLLGDKQGDQPKMGDEAKNGLPIVNRLMSKFDDCYPEQKLSMDDKFKKVGWFDKKTRWRVIYDFLAMKNDLAMVVDYKTGKVRDYAGFGGQLHLGAWVLFNIRPEIQTVNNAYLYLEHKHTVSIKLERDKDMNKLTDHFLEVFDTINSEKNFDEKKNKNCYFCLATPEMCSQKKAKREL